VTRRCARSLLVAAALAALGTAGPCPGSDPPSWPRYDDPGNPILHGDQLHPDAERGAAEIVPGAPLIVPGGDIRGSSDDLVVANVRGDVDLVLRTGAATLTGAILPPSLLAPGGVTAEAVAEPFGEGVPVPFEVVPSDGAGPYGNLAVPAYWSGQPILVLAFSDLDGDGYVGITELDGDATDAVLEEAELTPTGRAFALGEDGAGRGEIAIRVGGPPGARAIAALTAATCAGPYREDHRDGTVPDGPVVTTHLPFLPNTDPERFSFEGPRDPTQVGLASLTAAIDVRPSQLPIPSDPAHGEAFTLHLDGSTSTIDIARVSSGSAVRFGLVRVAHPDRRPTGPVRPGLDPGGNRVALEVLSLLALADDGDETREALQVVALDRLGNVAEPSGAAEVTLATSGGIRIASPDVDGDPFRETVELDGAEGVAIELDDLGGAWDDPPDARVLLESELAPTRVDVSLADPDVNDSGDVDALDLLAIGFALGAEPGDGSFQAALDVDGSGVIDEADLSISAAHLSEPIAVP
jgi:hypothetical protein